MTVAWDPSLLDGSPLHSPCAWAAPLLPADAWPEPGALLAYLRRAPRNAAGLPIRFVPQEASHGACAYERSILETGAVPTRRGDWHDLFNALAWTTWPATKAALNALHVREAAPGEGARRGGPRDAATLFDESGVVVASPDRDLLELVREFRWKELFADNRERVLTRLRLLVVGHGLWVQALRPFVGLTAHGLLLPVPESFPDLPVAGQVAAADALAAAVWSGGCAPVSPRGLSPVPLLGYPGWHPLTADRTFYDDRRYFRPGRRAA